MTDVSTHFRTQRSTGFYSLLIGQWGEGTMRCMTALALREHFTLFKHYRLCLCVCVKILQGDPCGL
jgi:hypothetical protein